MRFYLDEDVDATAIRRVLRANGHVEVWDTKRSGRAGSDDANQLVYSIEQRAVAITHDRNFTGAHVALPIGQVILLKCMEFDAADSLDQVLSLLVPILEHRPDVYVTVTRSSTGIASFDLNFGSRPG